MIKAVIVSIKKMKEVILESRAPFKAAVRRAWKLSRLASGWGHPTAENWRNDKAFILYQALILKWLSKLFGRAMLNEP